MGIGVGSGVSSIPMRESDRCNMAFSPQINLADLDGSNGFVINGVDTFDYAGGSVSSAGDVNGDGIADIIIGARAADPNGRDLAGESYVVFGKDSGFNSSLELSNLDGSNGFVLNGIGERDGFGLSVSSAGDVNGDGFDDVIIGTPSPSRTRYAGESYVVFGKGSGFSSSLELSNLDGSNGFIINGVNARDRSGISVSSAGDVNGDGFDDVIIGATAADPSGRDLAGESYVVFGKGSGFSSSLELSSLEGSNGFVINGIDNYDNSGFSVSGAGDVNGDGFDDVIIGAIGADPNGTRLAGESYVVFGKSNGFGSSLELSSLEGSNGFVINGINRFDGIGLAVSSAGDVNGDGFDDVIIGATDSDPDSTRYAGESYVVFGQASGFSSSLELSSLDGSNGFILRGIDELDRSGFSVSSAGDVNADGFDDVIIGARGADANGQSGVGESYVVFGQANGFSSSLDLSSLDGRNGFVLNGIDEFGQSGFSVSSAGDVNGDGIADIVIGAPRANLNDIVNIGASYVVFGKGRNTAPIAVDDTVVTNEDRWLSGSVFADNGSGADSDPDGDSFTVTAINSTTEDVGTTITLTSGALLTLNANGSFDYAPNNQFEALNDGEIARDSFTYTINDGNGGMDTATVMVTINGVTEPDVSDNPLTLIGTTLSDTLTGSNDDDFIRGRNGDDILTGLGGNDALDGGNGNDTLDGGSGNDTLEGGSRNDSLIGGLGEDTLDGGNGNDTLQGDNGKDTLKGGKGKDILDGGNGRDTLKGGNGKDALKGGNGKDALKGDNGNDAIDGGLGDDILGGGNGNDTLKGGLGNDILSGGVGRDVFVFAVGEGADTVTDFSDQDRISLAEGLGMGDLTFSGNDIIVTQTSEVLVTLTGIDTANLQNKQFVVL